MSCISILILVFFYDKVNTQDICDETKTKNVSEGVIGESKIFPWLGILRVHSHDNETVQIGLTGLVLVKQRYGVVNAHDVARITKDHLSRETKAMFIIEDGETWSCAVKDILLHPEYDYSTYNTIALVELDYEYNDDLIPICHPDNNYKTKNQLYAIGYVDDNRLLEKAIYSIEYVKRLLCDEFYDRVGFQEKNSFYKPTAYHCGFAPNNKNNCVWENGMILASNTSGAWVLIGFGIKGPGCAAPIRFIDLLSYSSWIETSTNEDNVYEY